MARQPPAAAVVSGDGGVGLPLESRTVVGQLLRKAFDELGAKPTREHAADVTIRLLAAVDVLGHAAGLFELASEAVQAIGGRPRPPSSGPGQLPPMRYVGFGPDPRQAQPSTPLEYLVSEFGTAILRGDRVRAWELFAPLAPADSPGAPVKQECADFLAMLVRNAWSRHVGGELHLTVPPADRWPPVCDFCCHDDGVWMWHCRGGDVRLRTGAGQQVATIRFDDMEFWYACEGCRREVGKAHPNWGRVFARQKQWRPQAHRPSVTAMYQAFELARTHVEPVPLPPQRPTPTPGRI